MKRLRVGYLVGGLVLLAAGLYFFVYLWRWEWNRAMVAGILFLSAEVGIGLALLLDRMRRLADRLERAPVSPEVMSRIREAAPPPRDHFEWLTPRDGRLGVFVPVLMGMGVVASLLAWVVERVARATAGPVLERGLAARLTPLGWPEGGLTGSGVTSVDDPVATSLLHGPAAMRARPEGQ